MAASRIVHELRTQVELEYLSSQRYLRLSKWCANRSMDDLSCFLQSRAQASITLMTQTFNYLRRIDSTAPASNVPLPDDCCCYCIEEVFEQTLLDLRIRLAHVSHLSRLVREAGDFATLAFLQKLFCQYRTERQHLIEIQQQYTHSSVVPCSSTMHVPDSTLCESV